MKKNRKQILLSIICMLVVAIVATNKFMDNRVFTTKVWAKTFADPGTTYVERIDINYETNKLRLSPGYTYREAMNLFESGWTYPDDAHYHNGYNAYFAYCPSASPCEYEDAHYVNSSEEYDEQVKGDRYHWVGLEPEINDCRGDDAVCEYDFDKEHLDQIEVYVNGVKIDNAVVNSYNTYWHLVRVYIPMVPYNGPLTKDIDIISKGNYVQRGTTMQFSADVDYYGVGGDEITWSITNNISSNTKINSSGLLTVDHDEESNYVVVKAASNIDNYVYDLKYITLIDEPLSIDDVTITEKTETVVYGGSFDYRATANGTASDAVTWSLTGANKPGTTISSDGKLTVAADETATSIVLTATSVFDNTKKASLNVQIRATEYIHKIEINYDTEAAVFSTRTTYRDAATALERSWSLPDNAGYDKGNDNVWFKRCETAERCELNEGIYITSSENMVDTYTYASFEIFAKPSHPQNNSNPLYDFENVTDANNYIKNIEIWVNGVKRDDAIVYDYNTSWRMVHVYVPITVTNGKLAQYFEFDYDTYDVYYGPDTRNNHIRTYNGVVDGEITYTSSNPNIATVDNEGNVTLKKVGTCTITATASETEDYKEYSRSYTLVIEPKYISPTITLPDATYHYIGSKITPEVTVTYEDIPLVENVDYTVTYDDNTDSGYGWVYINPVEGSNYTFSENLSKWFWIYVTNILYDDITISPSTVTYTGTEREVNVSVVVEGRTLIKDTDYTVEYSGNVSSGTAYVIVKGINNYAGTHSVSFEIVEAAKGDMNKNGKIDLADIILLLKKYLSGDVSDDDLLVGDMDDNGSIGLRDIIMLLKEYLKG